MKTVYAIIWRSTAPPEEFDKVLPDLMRWLRDLRERGVLRGCGGGAFGDADGGITLIECASFDEALAIAQASPQAQIGTSEVFEWQVYYADLKVAKDF